MRRYFNQLPAIREDEILAAIRQWAFPLDKKEDLQPLFDRIGNARIVMLGEASHGTHEYYTWRAHITQRLIIEKGFNLIAVEGDWPDAYRLNRYIKGYDESGKSPLDVLHEFNRWPTWMWANWEMVALANWLRQLNTGLPVNERVGFYGLDVYSLWESLESIMAYLSKTDTHALEIAKEAARCFDPYRQSEGTGYARAAQLVPELCEQEVVTLLREIRESSLSYNSDPENVFSLAQNARVAVNAESYYRSLVKGGPHSWNLRDRHMADTMEELLKYHGPESKLIVWAHNTHIGDARATDMADEGMYNLGELARVAYGNKEVFLVGFGSFKGTVIAGKSWGASIRQMKLPEAAAHTWENYLHQARGSDLLLLMDDFQRTDSLMENRIGHRAVGVVYNPAYEAYGNYVPSVLPLRYDAFIHLEETRALYPLHIEPDGQQIPETYPFGV